MMNKKIISTCGLIMLMSTTSIYAKNFKINEKEFVPRFFYNNYQLQIKQYHILNHEKIMDGIITLSDNSSKVNVYKDNMIKKESDGTTYQNNIYLNYMLIPNFNETNFIFDYTINFEKEIKDESKNTYYKSNIQTSINDKTLLSLDQKTILKNKNYRYEILLQKTTPYNKFFKIDKSICKTISCDILKENTLNYIENLKKENKFNQDNDSNKKEVIKEIKLNKNVSLKNKTHYNAIESKNYILYRVKKGDTLSSIAYKFNVPELLVKRLNNMKTTHIRSNDVLVIKNKSTVLHKIEEGDTLYSIAKYFNKNENELAKLNNLKNKTLIKNKLLIIEK